MTAKVPPLAQRVVLGKTERQSEGELYEAFLSWNNDARGPRITKWHHYFDIYEHHISRFRGTDCHLLEFGVFDGGSLLMWSDYLGPKAKITGVDINPKVKRFDKIRPNVNVVIGDQADGAVLTALAEEHGPFDVVIDDGGHTARQQINSFNGIYGSVSERGVYLCEDTHTSYLPKFQDAGPGKTMIEHAKRLVDEMHALYQADGLRRFAQRMHEREGEIAMTRFAATTFSIQFYDSVIVFEKRPRSEPFSEFR